MESIPHGEQIKQKKHLNYHHFSIYYLPEEKYDGNVKPMSRFQ
jgi:hypothetical protein